MAILEMSDRLGEQPGKLAGAPFRRIGGPREFSTFAVLVLCFAIAVVFVVQRGNRQGPSAAAKPVTAVQPARASNPPSTAPISFSNDSSAEFGAAANNIADSAVDIADSCVKMVWEPARWLSNRIVSFVADAWVDPVNGDRLLFNGAPDVFNLAVAVLALAILGVVSVTVAGPLYFSWKTWRLSRAHYSRNRQS